jgi:hypothetical protein
MAFASVAKKIKVRKTHRCQWCNEIIPKNSYAYSWSGTTVYNELHRTYMHPECYHPAIESGAMWDDDWYPGDWHRGCTCANGEKCDIIEHKLNRLTYQE